jgi:hypothetical protein
VLAPRLLDEAADIRDDGVARVGTRHDTVLHVDHEQRRVGPVLERRHGCLPG